MNLFAFYRSTVGKKMVMAVTGIALLLFVLGHMTGNMKAFFGFDSMGVPRLDHYAEFLRTIGEVMFGHGGFLWIMRIGLLGVVFLHIVTAVQLTMLNRSSRPVAYARTNHSSATVASKTMAIGGIIILCFVVFHILHMTTGQLHFHGFEEGKVYSNVYNAFRHGWVVAIYVLAMGVLLLHLYHGSWSLFQTLGIESPGWNPYIRTLAKLLSIVIAFGFMSVPLGVYFHVLPPPPMEGIQIASEAGE